MSIRGKVVASALVRAAAVAGVILLWPAPDAAPTAPTSDQIKVSAQARLDAPLKAGRTRVWQVGHPAYTGPTMIKSQSGEPGIF
ncbi:hypothetical protein ABZ468_20090 [Streptomyces sp. NPDC005708]|uniref:hypothetical protein n=1 Tax=Streptomyces sp. NPDC005708 TaxID=3154564 RepID=UPI0033F83BDC